MWLPSSIYESLPCAYFLGGLLFVAGAIYLGPGVAVTPLYLALGIISMFSGVLVFIKRWHFRSRDLYATSDDITK